MNLLLLLNGNKEKIFKAHGFDENEFDVVKVDEKLLVNPKAILRIIKSQPYNSVYYGCIELELQRFHVFMKIYILLSLIFKGSIIDEQGCSNEFKFIKLFLFELTFLFFEMVASAFVVLFFYIKLPITKWIYLKNH